MSFLWVKFSVLQASISSFCTCCTSFILRCCQPPFCTRIVTFLAIVTYSACVSMQNIRTSLSFSLSSNYDDAIWGCLRWQIDDCCWFFVEVWIGVPGWQNPGGQGHPRWLPGGWSSTVCLETLNFIVRLNPDEPHHYPKLLRVGSVPSVSYNPDILRGLMVSVDSDHLHEFCNWSTAGECHML